MLEDTADRPGIFIFELEFPGGSRVKRPITHRPDLSPTEWSSLDIHHLLIRLATEAIGAPPEPGEPLFSRVGSTSQGGILQVTARGATATLVLSEPLNPLSSDEWNERHPIRVWYAPPRTPGSDEQ